MCKGANFTLTGMGVAPPYLKGCFQVKKGLRLGIFTTDFAAP